MSVLRYQKPLFRTLNLISKYNKYIILNFLFATGIDYWARRHAICEWLF